MSTLQITSIDTQTSRIVINYLFNGDTFQRGFAFPKSIDLELHRDDPTFQRLVAYCTIADSIYTFGLDYYDHISLPFKLDEAEKSFFETAFLYGLAEFRYVNKLPIRQSVNLTWADDAPVLSTVQHKQDVLNGGRAFVLNGGGKDGVVAMEIAKQLDLDLAWFVSGTADSRSRIVSLSGVEDLISVDRVPSDYIKDHRRYTGHKPMSLYVAMIASLTAYLTGRQYVISANEYSASFPNLVVDGFQVNHQFTKSYEFEELLRALYISHNIPVYYFSATRPLYELQVLQIFANYPAYHAHFLSCNQGMSHDTWCKHCAKCAFVIGSMYLYSPETSKEVWGESRELFNANKLVDELIELINPDIKPLECIGTLAENRILLSQLLASDKIVMNANQAERYEKYMVSGISVVEAIDLDRADREDNFPSSFARELRNIIAAELKKSQEGNS